MEEAGPEGGPRASLLFVWQPLTWSFFAQALLAPPTEANLNTDAQGLEKVRLTLFACSFSFTKRAFSLAAGQVLRSAGRPLQVWLSAIR